MAIQSQEPNTGTVELPIFPKGMSYSFSKELRREINNHMQSVVSETRFNAMTAARYGGGESFTKESIIYLGLNRAKNAGWSVKEKASVGIRVVSTSEKHTHNSANVKVSVFDAGIENAIGKSLKDVTIFERSFHKNAKKIMLFSGPQCLNPFPYATDINVMLAIRDLRDARLELLEEV